MGKRRVCPYCKAELVRLSSACADGDEECDCDQFYRCPHCNRTFYKNCDAHRDYFWFGAEPLGL